MWNTFNQEDNSSSDKGEYESRNNQDNFYSLSAYNNNYQYCRCCVTERRFEFDRCVVCKSN